MVPIPGLAGRLALALLAGRTAGRSGIVERATRLHQCVPVSYGPVMHPSGRAEQYRSLDAGEVVEVLTDGGIVLLDRVRSAVGQGVGEVFLDGHRGLYARHRIRRADKPTRWSARGWWRIVDNPQPGVWHDWALSHADPEHPERGTIGQCLVREGVDRLVWHQSPPDGAVILQWRTRGRPVDFYGLGPRTDAGRRSLAVEDDVPASASVAS